MKFLRWALVFPVWLTTYLAASYLYAWSVFALASISFVPVVNLIGTALAVCGFGGGCIFAGNLSARAAELCAPSHKWEILLSALCLGLISLLLSFATFGLQSPIDQKYFALRFSIGLIGMTTQIFMVARSRTAREAPTSSSTA